MERESDGRSQQMWCALVREREKKERGKQAVCGAPAKADEML